MVCDYKYGKEEDIYYCLSTFNNYQNVLYAKIYNILKVIFLSSPKLNFRFFVTFGQVDIVPHGFGYPTFCLKPLYICAH